MSLLSAFHEAHDKANSKAESERRKLWREYRQILDRRDEPREGDAARLVPLTQQLGIDAPFVELHSLALDLAAKAQAALADLPKHEAAAQKAMEEREAWSRRHLEAEAHVRELGAEEAKHRDALREISAAHQDDFGRLKAQFPGLFGIGIENMPADVQDANSAIQRKRRALGIPLPSMDNPND
jgi:hypothetical protein